MSLQSIILVSLIFGHSGKTLLIPKLNTDSIDAIYSDMHRAHYIYATMKNGKNDTILSNEDGALMLFTVSMNNAWFTMGNPNRLEKKGRCGVLLCALHFGMCKCRDVLIDSSSSIVDISEDEEGGFYYYKRTSKATNFKKKPREKQKPIHVSEEEMTRRFRDDFIKSPKL